MHDVEAGAVAERLARVQQGKQVVWLTGAGLSVASGISPYRGADDAVWANFITEWGTIARFRRDPAAWYREFWFKAHPSLKLAPGTVRPNEGHGAIAALQKRLGHRLVTQNIDGLHRDSGSPSASTVEIHGRHDVFVCPNERCSLSHTPLEGVDVLGFLSDDPPECDACGAVLRPLVLLFDEYYESQPFYRARDARDWLNDAEVVVFVGTSFSVGITSMALHAAQASLAQIINVNPVPLEVPGVMNLRVRSEVGLPDIARALGA